MGTYNAFLMQNILLYNEFEDFVALHFLNKIPPN